MPLPEASTVGVPDAVPAVGVPEASTVSEPEASTVGAEGGLRLRLRLRLVLMLGESAMDDYGGALLQVEIAMHKRVAA